MTNPVPMRQPRTDLARLVESIKAAVYANGDGLSDFEAHQIADAAISAMGEP